MGLVVDLVGLFDVQLVGHSHTHCYVYTLYPTDRGAWCGSNLREYRVISDFTPIVSNGLGLASAMALMAITRTTRS